MRNSSLLSPLASAAAAADAAAMVVSDCPRNRRRLATRLRYGKSKRDTLRRSAWRGLQQAADGEVRIVVAEAALGGLAV